MARPSPRHLIATAALGLAACWSVAVLAAAPAPAPPAGAATPAADPLKTAFEALAEPDRRAVQTALIWVADYTAAVSAAYGPRTRDALTAYAKENGQPPLAVLDPAGRTRLVAAGKAVAATVGFGAVVDKRAGLAIALPHKILTKVTTTDTGTRYASGDTSSVLDTLSRPAGAAGLSGLFDRMSAATDTRIVTYKFSKPDFFVVTGESADRKFYSRFAIEPEGGDRAGADRLIRGFTFTYPKADAKRMDRITIAMAAAFDPFPAATAGPAGAAKPQAATSPTPESGPKAQAIVVAPGLALTSLAPQRCPAPQVGGAAASFKASDASSGLALLSVPNAAAPSPSIADRPDAEGVYFALFKQADKLEVAPATLHDAPKGPLVSSPLQQGAAGAPLITREGRLAGTVRAGPTSPKTIAGTVLEADYPVADATAIRTFLGRAGVTLADAATPSTATLGGALTPWGSSLMTVTCGPPPAPAAPAAPVAPTAPPSGK